MNIIISLSVGALCFFMISASNRFDKGAKVIALVDLEVGQVLDGLRGYEVKARSWELERLRLQDGDFSVSSDGWEDNVAYSSLLSFNTKEPLHGAGKVRQPLLLNQTKCLFCREQGDGISGSEGCYSNI